MYSQALTMVKKVPLWVWAAAALGVAVYVIKKGSIQTAVADATAGAVSSAGSVVSGIGAGAVLGIGDILGVPRTDETLCQKAMREGDNWSASKYCTASQFFAYQKRGVQKTIENLFNW